jgi:pimeloyl-ACP methyl ester carboxylesterase
VAHGFSASRDDAAVRALADALQGAGCNVLTYDARGHGDSEGWCAVGTEEHLDVAAAVEQALTAGRPVVVIGVSMGAIGVVHHLADACLPDAVAGAVLVSAPARWRMRLSPIGVLTAALTRTGPGRWVAGRRLRVRVARRWRVGEPLEDAIRRIDRPVAIVHGMKDRLLDAIHGRKLHGSALGPSRLDLVARMGHGVDDAARLAVVDAVTWVLDAAGPVVGDHLAELTLAQTPTATPAGP